MLHIDMDYFYAQIEELRHPEFKDKIIVVCVFSGRTQDSGVVSTVNYEGRKVGVKSGIPIINAKKLAPNGIFLPVDHDFYEQISNEIDQIIRTKCSKVEKRSIDEWYCLAEKEVEVAKLIKNEIFKATKLNCTIGIAPSKLGAKMASDKGKPNGLLVLDKKQERELIDNSHVEKIVGIGPKTTNELNSLGVQIVKDLKKVDQFLIIEKFGKNLGVWLFNLSNGIYESELEERSEKDEISKIGSLKFNSRHSKVIFQKISELEKEAKIVLIKSKKSYKTLTLIFITETLKMHTKSHTFSKPRSEKEDNSKEIEVLISKFLLEDTEEIRRVGIRFSNLVEMDGQTTLF